MAAEEPVVAVEQSLEEDKIEEKEPQKEAEKQGRLIYYLLLEFAVIIAVKWKRILILNLSAWKKLEKQTRG